MAAGAFSVRVEPPDNYLNMRLPPVKPEDALPEDQVALRSDIYSALFVLRQLNEAEHPNLQQYAKRLRSIAILGLCGQEAQTDIASKALEQLKAEVVDHDGQLIKNRYARMMGYMAAADAFLGAYLYAAIKCNYWPWFLGAQLGCLGLTDVDLVSLRSYMFAWGGALAGAWVSFIWRQSIIAFNDLGRIRPNWITAQIRLLYTAIQTLVIGVLMHLQMIAFQVGRFDTVEFATNSLVALLVGVLCGYSEKLLPLVIASKASTMFGASEENGPPPPKTGSTPPAPTSAQPEPAPSEPASAQPAPAQPGPAEPAQPTPAQPAPAKPEG